jgi:hypothetical protein
VGRAGKSRRGGAGEHCEKEKIAKTTRPSAHPPAQAQAIWACVAAVKGGEMEREWGSSA